jgi:hypothetical protein
MYTRTAPAAQTEQLPQINRGQQGTAEAAPRHLPAAITQLGAIASRALSRVARRRGSAC